MRLVDLLVLLATSSAILSGNDYYSMECLGVDRVYESMKEDLQTHPMYYILKNREEGICYRRKTNYYDFYNTCCDSEKEIALAISSSSLFRRYIYSDCLQDFKYALLDIISHYKGETSAVFDRRSVEKAMDGGSNNYTEFLNILMKDQLRVYWEQLKRVEIADISDSCFEKAVNFQAVFKKHLDDFLGQLAVLRDGITIAIDLIDALQEQKISPKCVEAITRSSALTIGCNQCQDETASYRTCQTYCANVVNGCMKPLLPIVPVWERWQAIMDTLDSNFTMKKEQLVALNISGILYKEFIYDFHAQLEDPENCGFEKFQNNSKRRSRNIERISENSGISEPRHYYNLFHGMFDNIQYKFCNELGFANKSDNQCWNGTHVGTYNRNLTMFNEESQQYNLEVPDSGFIYYKAQEALEKLKNFNHKFNPRLDGDINLEGSATTGMNIEPLTTVPESLNNTEKSTSRVLQPFSFSSHIITLVAVFSLQWVVL